MLQMGLLETSTKWNLLVTPPLCSRPAAMSSSGLLGRAFDRLGRRHILLAGPSCLGLVFVVLSA